MPGRTPLLLLSAAALALCVCAAQPALYVRPGLSVRPGPPEGEIRLEFVAVGDFGTGDYHAAAVARQITEAMKRMPPPRFLLALGDNFYEKGVRGPSEADRAFDRVIDATGYGPLMREARVPAYLIPGNHDHQGSVQTQRDAGRRRYGDLWRHPIDSTDAFLPRRVSLPQERPAIDLILVDSEAMISARDDHAFHRHVAVLDSLLRISTAPWRVLAAHHPVRSVGKHARRRIPFSHLFLKQDMGSKRYRRYIAAMKDLLVRRKVHLCLYGHDHSLQVFQPPGQGTPVHIVSGAGGKSSPVKPLPATDDLLYAQQAYGFFRVAVADGLLSYAAVDTSGAVLFSGRITR